MRERRALLGALIPILPLLAAPGAPEPIADVLLEERLRIPIADLAARVPLAPGEEFRVVELGRDTGTSQHLVAIRTAEVPHRHDRHDLFVVMVRGSGTWRMGDETLPVGQGSLLYVPRGTVHAFTNESRTPAVAYAVYTPPFDGSDRVEVGSAEDPTP
jgi:mannose-6-phosphate isomerase-like protein (cupin superfamily)